VNVRVVVDIGSCRTVQSKAAQASWLWIMLEPGGDGMIREHGVAGQSARRAGRVRRLRRLILGGMVCLFSGTWCPLAVEEIRQYRQTTGDRSVLTELRLVPEGSGWREIGEHSELVETAEFASLRWDWRDPGEKTDLVVTAGTGVLHAEGRLRGKSLSRDFPTNGLPWAQNQELRLEWFVRSGMDRTVFCSFDPGSMTLYEFEATARGRELVSLNGRSISACRVHLNLNGLLAAFWGADYWLDPVTGHLLRSKAINGHPGTPPTVVEAIF
jgi:hypothetical protein